METPTPQVNIIRPQPRITLEPPVVLNVPYKVGEELLALNNNWGAPLLQQPKVSYNVHTPKDLDPPQIIDSYNEYNLSPKDKSLYVNKLEKETIMQFLNRTSINVENGQVFDLRPISHVTSSSMKNMPFISLPPPLSSLSVSYLHVVLSPISVHGSAITLTNYQGCLFLIDQEKNSVATEAAYFVSTDGQPRFVQTNGTDLYFEVQNCKPSILLVIILMHSEALDLDNFVEEITSKATPKEDPKKSPIPFAYSYITPFKDNNSSTVSFNFPWSLVRPSDDFSSLFGNTSSDFDSISLIGKATIQVLPFENLPHVRLTSEEKDTSKDNEVFNNNPADNSNSPLLALSIPQRTFFPTSIISLSSITFTFNNPPKGDYAMFRVFLSDNLTDPLKPDSLPVFISRAREPLLNSYESTGMPLSRHIVFPDIIRMRLDKPLASTSNIIIQFITVGKKESTIYKLTAFPLFVDNNIIQTSAHTFFTHHSKDLKSQPDYLTKCQKSKKSSVSLYIDIPQVFYPPAVLTQLATALLPEQIASLPLKQLGPEVLLPQLIPIVSKLFTIIAPPSAVYLLDIISMFKADDSKPQLRSWLFHNFDPKVAKTYFLSSFTNSINGLIMEAIEKKQNDVINNLIKSFDIICDILITSYMLKKEDYFPNSLYTMFISISEAICYEAEGGHVNEVIGMNHIFGDVMFIFHSLTNEHIMNAVRCHIKKVLDLHNPEYLFLIWDFLMRFTDTNEFALYIASHFPVKPITRIIFSPYNKVSSMIFMAITETFSSGDKNSITLCCNFICRLFLPLENDDVPNQMRYRIAYAFFPIFEIITISFDKLELDQKLELLPAILFMLGYSPQQLLRYHFISNTSNMQTQFIKFLQDAIDTIYTVIGPERRSTTYLNGVFDEFTKRILQLLNYNVRGLKDYLQSSIDVLSKLMNSPYQIPNNYPLLFDTVSRVIHYYPCQKPLVMSLLTIVTSKQHLVRCFATSLILLFFKSDYDTRKTVVVSSVEVLDSVTNLMLHSPQIDDIQMYKLMLNTIGEMSKDVFNVDDFTKKLCERTTAANNIANIIEKMRETDKTPEEHCRYVMNIADQYQTYPSMRVNWLREIVQINLKNNSYSSAFVAQLHICALIATVIMHESSFECSIESSEFKKQFNLLVCQPISYGKKLILSQRLFEFFPSVLEETKIDFGAISEDFKFIASDFTLQYLNEALVDAIDLGIKAKLYYSVRPLYSLQLRIMDELGKYKSMGEICENASELFKKLKANGTMTYTNTLSFFVAYNDNPNEKVIYSVEEENVDSFIENCKSKNTTIEQIYEFEQGFAAMHQNGGGEFESQHCWTIFRNKPTLDYLIKNVKDINQNEVELIQYKTSYPLPFYMISLPVANEQNVRISLIKHIQIEVKKVDEIINQVAYEFERFFPCASNSKVYGNYSIHYKDDIERIVATLQCVFPVTFETPQSEPPSENQPEPSEDQTSNSITLYDLLKVLADKGGKREANNIAQTLSPSIERLLEVFKTVINASNDKSFNTDYEVSQEQFVKFRKQFGLKENNELTPYQGKVDPLLEKFDYE